MNSENGLGGNRLGKVLAQFRRVMCASEPKAAQAIAPVPASAPKRAARPALMPKPRKVGGMDVTQITGVVLPEKPVFDKVIALFLFLAFGLRMEVQKIAALPISREREGAADGELGLSFWGGAPVYRGRTIRGRRYAAGGNRPTDNQERRWRRTRAYTIDVGDNKYQARGTASAAECVAWDVGLIQKWGLQRLFEATHEWIVPKLELPKDASPEQQQEMKERYEHLKARARRRAASGLVWDGERRCEVDAHQVVDEWVRDARERVALHYVLLASRNNGTGYLKWSHHSMVYLMRELQKPDVLSQEDIDRGWVMWTIPSVVRFTLDAVVADFRVRVGIVEGRIPDFFGNDAARRLGTALLKQDETIGRFFIHPEAAGDVFADFNFASHLRNLVALGTPLATVAHVADTVIDTVISQTMEQKEKARECLALCDKEPFGGGFGMVLMSADPAIADNPRVAREMWRQHPLVRVAVVINSRRQVSILSDGSVPLDEVALRLEQIEPNRWFTDPRIGAILNGGHSFTQVPATDIPLGQIIRLLETVIYGMN